MNFCLLQWITTNWDKTCIKSQNETFNTPIAIDVSSKWCQSFMAKQMDVMIMVQLEFQ